MVIWLQWKRLTVDNSDDKKLKVIVSICPTRYCLVLTLGVFWSLLLYRNSTLFQHTFYRKWRLLVLLKLWYVEYLSKLIKLTVSSYMVVVAMFNVDMFIFLLISNSVCNLGIRLGNVFQTLKDVDGFCMYNRSFGFSFQRSFRFEYALDWIYKHLSKQTEEGYI